MTIDCSASNDIKWFESDIDGVLWEVTINSLNSSFPSALPLDSKHRAEEKMLQQLSIAQEWSSKFFISTYSPRILSDKHKKNMKWVNIPAILNN